MNCQHCNNPVPENATSCPSCNTLQQPAKPKSRTVYGLLAFFLGGLGIHNFYAKRYVFGVIQLVLGLCQVFMPSQGIKAILMVILLFWVLTEMLVVKKDGNGIPFAKAKSL